jgi:hypothetical protein
VGVSVYMPDVRDATLLEVVVDALADADQAVLVAASEPQKLQLPGARRGSGRSADGGCFVFGVEEKPPIQANVSM